MTQLDLNKMACVGAPASKRSKILRCIEKRCEGCDTKIYISSDALRIAKRDASRAGVGICLVCWKCAGPWVQDVARKGGLVQGQESILRDELLPRIERAADDQLHSN